MKITNKGFSLIELLVALSILAVVAAIIVPKFMNVRNQAVATVVTAQAQQIQQTVQNFISLGGAIGANPDEGGVLAFLNTQSAPPAGRLTVSGVTDSTGNFGSNTIMLTIPQTGTYAAGVAGAAQGWYYTAGGGHTTSARYVDGAGAVHLLTINADGSVTLP